MKIRLTGLPAEVNTAAARLADVVTVLETSRPYPRRRDSALVSLYLDVTLDIPTRQEGPNRAMNTVTYTHPDVLTAGVVEGWADPETDPTRIDWTARQSAAAIPFEVIDGRPVNPCERTPVRYGRNELGHWGEALAADALVSATDPSGRRWIVMVERADGHGWALPGGHVDPGESPTAAAVRELEEETGLALPAAHWTATAPRYVPDPRASDEAWMVTVLCTAHLGTLDRADFPTVAGADDAAQAAWVRADTYPTLTAHLAEVHGGRVFAAHVDMLRGALDMPGVDR